MGYDLKEEYLNKKYAEYDDESDGRYMKKRHVSKRVKKSDHRHEYENVVVIDPTVKDSFYLVGRCKVCGRMSHPVKDIRIERKFPHSMYYTWHIGYVVSHEDEYEAFVKWCKEHYTVYEVENFSLWDNKYL